METWIILFLLSSVLLILTPGQDMILVMSRSIGQGAKSGIVTAAGISTGLLGHTLFMTLGLGAVIRASETLFFIIKIGGALYLFYLGMKMLLSKKEQLEFTQLEHKNLRSQYLQGMLANLSNPKIAIFFISYLPQFVPANTTHPTTALLVLGVTFAAMTFLIKAPIGYGAGSLSKWLRNRSGIQMWFNRISGIVLIGLGLKLATAKRI